VKLLIHIRDVVLDCPFCERQLEGDFTISFPLRYERENAQFLWREQRESGSVVPEVFSG
jgi:hypothetical protein